MLGGRSVRSLDTAPRAHQNERGTIGNHVNAAQHDEPHRDDSHKSSLESAAKDRSFPSSEHAFDSRHPLHGKPQANGPGLLCCQDSLLPACHSRAISAFGRIRLDAARLMGADRGQTEGTCPPAHPHQPCDHRSPDEHCSVGGGKGHPIGKMTPAIPGSNFSKD